MGKTKYTREYKDNSQTTDLAKLCESLGKQVGKYAEGHQLSGALLLLTDMKDGYDCVAGDIDAIVNEIMVGAQHHPLMSQLLHKLWERMNEIKNQLEN